MSDLIPDQPISDSKDCPASALKPVHKKITAHEAYIGDGLLIRRVLPNPERRMIGAWCFLDHFGPIDLKKTGLDIPPHPHMGLQTLTWPIAGEIFHCDSLGSEQVIKPGQVNLMTSGRGISHSEESVPDTVLHGVQLWIALPNAARNVEPAFEHHAKLPVHEKGEFHITLIAGELWGERAPVTIYTPLVGIDLYARKHAEVTLPLNPDFEYGFLVLEGNAKIDGDNMEVGTLLYTGCGLKQVTISAPPESRVLVVGGEPFDEEILLWWNFVARSEEEIRQGVIDWQNQSARFGEVKGYTGGRLKAPKLPN